MTETEFVQRVEACKGKLYRVAYLYFGSQQDALDVLDEAVYKGLLGAKKLRQPEFFETWLTRILLNVCHTEQKRRKRLTPLDHAAEPCCEDFDGLPLREAIGKLAPELRAVVTLRYFEGLTLAECARTLNIPQGTVVTRQRRALALLRLELEEVEV